MADRHLDRRWSLEAPDRQVEKFISKREAVRYLNQAVSPSGRWLIRRLGEGCYRVDPPILRAPVVLLGPWLLYNGKGASYLQTLEQHTFPWQYEAIARSTRGDPCGL